MFCGKCGAKNNDAAAFCRECGERLRHEKRAAGNIHTLSAVEKRRISRDKQVGLLVVAVAVVLIVGMIFLVFGGRSYKATVKKFVAASGGTDAEKFFELIPQELINFIMEEEEFESRKEMLEEMEEELAAATDELDDYLGKDWKISHKILSAETMDKDELEEVREGYEDVDIKISAAKCVEVEFTVKSGEDEVSNSMELSVIKIGRDWYLDIFSIY